MEEMTKEQFNDRLRAVNRAMSIFGHMTDNDITKSFIAYQKILATQGRKIFVNNMGGLSDELKKYERPKCVKCGFDMMFRPVQENVEGIKLQLVCNNAGCDTVLNSKEDLDWWRQHLKKKEI